MNHNIKNFFNTFIFLFAFLFLLTSCANLPLIGKKKEQKSDELPPGKTVTIEGMERVKGVNPPKSETPSSTQTSSPKQEKETKVASIPTKPIFTPTLPPPIYRVGFKQKVAILDFENKTTYKDEKIGEIVAKKLSEKLEAAQRVITIDKTVVSETLNREGFKFETLTEPSVMKHAHQSLGIQAFTLGAVKDLSLITSKPSETSEEEVTFATAKVEIRLIDASTGNLLKTFIGRSPLFGTKETGEYSRSKAVLKAIDFSLDDILEGFLRQIDFLDWTTTIAKIEGGNIYIHAGKLSGLRVGETLEVFEPGKEIIHPTTKYSLGWTTGQLKGTIKITELFSVDAAVGKVIKGQGFSLNDLVKSPKK